MNSLRGKKILVTGATGFIGSRVVERLVLEQGADVVALVHKFQNASRLARFPVKMIAGDVADAGCVADAARGCDAIVHCAVSFSGSAEDNRRVTVEGARSVCEAAAAEGARLVHFSTFSVYGDTLPGSLNEEAAKSPGTDAYGASKLEAEQMVLEYHGRGLSAVIFQPTVVYGPWSFWSRYAAQLVAQGVVALPDGGEGLCNAVYVDDVADAVFLSLQRDVTTPGPFLISGHAPLKWRDFFLAHAANNIEGSVELATAEELASLAPNDVSTPLSLRSVLSVDFRYHLKGLVLATPGFKHAYRSLPLARKANQALRAILRAKHGEPAPDDGQGVSEEPRCPRVLPDPAHLPLLRSRTEVAIDSAKRHLGYSPKFPLAQGGSLTRQWLDWGGR